MRDLTAGQYRIFDRYAGLSLPRHVSYPMPTWWKDIGPPEAARLRERSFERTPTRGLSLYLHIPFCRSTCRFCACNRMTIQRDCEDDVVLVRDYLNALDRELALRAEDMGRNGARPVGQIHWGGGTPTFLECREMERLHAAAADRFHVAPDAELSIEVDPRATSAEQIALLGQLGFNRISLGIQDFDPAVQERIGRIQPLDLIEETMASARAAGIANVNFDLIYGLPLQTLESIERMIDQAIALRPGRIAFYHFAMLPDRIANHRGMDLSSLPGSSDKLRMFLLAVERFEDAGYRFIGLDHFALPGDGLAKAASDGTLTRTFQGMTTGGELDLLGLGCSSIGGLPGRAYIQNQRNPGAYIDAMNSTGEPAFRGMALSEDDAVRQHALKQLYCDGVIDPVRLREDTGAEFSAYFSEELPLLERLAADELVEMDPGGGIRLTMPLGRVLMRNVAAVFDAYLPKDAPWTGMERNYSASA